MSHHHVANLLLGEVLADLQELVLAHCPTAVLVHVLEHLEMITIVTTIIMIIIVTFSRGVSSPMNSPKERRPS